MATYAPNMFCNFYLVKNANIANDSAIAKAEEKFSRDLDYLEV